MLFDLFPISILTIFAYLAKGKITVTTCNLVGLIVLQLIPNHKTKLLVIFGYFVSVFSIFFFVSAIVKAKIIEIGGIDIISNLFICLTLLLILCCIVYNWIYFLNGFKYFLSLLLLLQFFLINVFLSSNLLVFFVYFESVLLPMLIIIGLWGSRQRKIHALYYLFFYTMVGSVFILIGIIYLLSMYGSLEHTYLLHQKLTFGDEIILVTLFFLGFAVKVPLWPFHIWLPEAHVESPTSGSVMLAGILLKLGTYGLLKFLLPLFPNGAYFMAPPIYTLCILGIIYCSFTILTQLDLKKVIAYSSVIHMSYCIIGLFSFNIIGLTGSVLTMLSHGIISGALFFLVGSLYDKYRTRNILYFGSLAMLMPIFTTFFLLFSFANMSLPGLFSFLGELLILIGIIERSVEVFISLCVLTFFGVLYSMWLYNRVCLGSTNLKIEKKKRGNAAKNPFESKYNSNGFFAASNVKTSSKPKISIIDQIQKPYLPNNWKDCSFAEIAILSILSAITILCGLVPDVLIYWIEIALIDLLKFF